LSNLTCRANAKLYFAVIEAIERMLDQAERRFNTTELAFPVDP
jgi:hypothetical protein